MTLSGCLRGVRPPAWVADGFRAGIATSVQVPIAVAVVAALPDLRFIYPLVLLPLLLAGPLAARGVVSRAAMAAMLLAGALSGLTAACGLAVGSQLLGTSVWGLTGAASAPPMPPLPRPGLLPSELMTWAQQDVLLLQPPLALALGLLAALGRGLAGASRSWRARVLPRSLRGRLTLAFGGLTALTFVVGSAGFSALEEMHYRAHLLQVQADWQQHLSEARLALGAAERAWAEGRTGDAVAHAEAVDVIYAHLQAGQPHAGLIVSSSTFRAVAARYEERLVAVRDAHGALRANPADPRGAEAARTILDAFRQQVDADMVQLLGIDDLAHHQRLMMVMLVVGLAGAFGIVLTGRIVAEIDTPIRRLVAHLAEVARGDFARRVDGGGPDELRRLAGSVNAMTDDLGSLYAAEQDRVAAAEAVAARERELAAAKEFWANTVVHDLKGPLSLIGGYAELLEADVLGPLGARQREAVSEMRRASGELLGLVEDINDSFRLEAAALPLERQPIAPAVLLLGAVYEHTRPERRAPRLDFPGDLPDVPVDVRLIKRVLGNLIGNAYKHAGPEANVVLRSRLWGGQVCFAVEDDGPGIPPEERERVFERFVQGAGGRCGSGLGLAFCKLVVEQHGGHIWTETVESGGARVCMALPVGGAAAEPAPCLTAA